MMRELSRRGEEIAARRVAAIADALVSAAGDLPPDLAVDRLEDGIAIRGSGLARRLAFDGRLRGLTIGLRSARR